MKIILNNDKLYEKSEVVMDDEYKKVHLQAKKMISLCIKNDKMIGLGLTAVQVGVMKTFFVAYLQGEWNICINPKILSYGKKNKSHESCLSFPDRDPIIKMRSRKIKAEWTTYTGEVMNKTLKKLDAIVFQHEYDHTLGICCYPKQ